MDSIVSSLEFRMGRDLLNSSSTCLGCWIFASHGGEEGHRHEVLRPFQIFFPWLKWRVIQSQPTIFYTSPNSQGTRTSFSALAPRRPNLLLHHFLQSSVTWKSPWPKKWNDAPDKIFFQGVRWMDYRTCHEQMNTLSESSSAAPRWRILRQHKLGSV